MKRVDNWKIGKMQIYHQELFCYEFCDMQWWWRQIRRWRRWWQVIPVDKLAVCYKMLQITLEFVANCYRTKGWQWNELKLYMMHYWRLADLHARFHVSAATRRSVATCWKMGCLQKSSIFIKYLAKNLYVGLLEPPCPIYKWIPVHRLAVCSKCCK